MESRGYLRSRSVRSDKRVRRLYSITARGRAALADAREKVRELFGEMFEEKH
jgi:PadR family transcriptional regulator PadR